MFTSVQSRFKMAAYTPVVAGIIMPIGVLILFYYLYIANGLFVENGAISWPVYLIVAIICIQAGVVVWAMATRLVRLDISGYGVKAKGFYGYGKEKEWLFANLEGFTIGHQERKNKEIVEYIILWQGDKKALRIEASYFENYEDIKAALSRKLENLSVAEEGEGDE